MKYCVFFDLDETVIKTKSMLDVMEAYYQKNSLFYCIGKLRFRYFVKKILGFSKNNKDRKVLNQFYYQQLSGISAEKILKTSYEWLQDNKKELFNESVLFEIKRHQDRGAEIILVTGSFLECVLPIADYLNIHHVVCAPLEKIKGRYTGKMLGEPTVGVGKSSAVMGYINQHQLPLKGSYAYGDHESDLSMLLMSDYPVVVGQDPVLLREAKKNGWLIIE